MQTLSILMYKYSPQGNLYIKKVTNAFSKTQLQQSLQEVISEAIIIPFPINFMYVSFQIYLKEYRK